MSETLRLRGFSGIISNPVPFRYFFFIFGVLGVLTDLFYEEHTLAGIYILTVIILAFAYWNIPFQIVATLIITIIRYAFTPMGLPEVAVIATTWLSYLAITITLSSVVRNYITTKKNLITLTEVLAKTLDSRDKFTADHSANVALYAYLIAQEMNLGHKETENIYIGGLLHDLGKIGVPEAILKKPARLENEEFEQIKRHPVIGYNILKSIRLFQKNGILDMVKHHHERFDGKGYPDGLEGINIPKVARIMAVADAFDAMTSRRVYREGNGMEYAIDEIRKNKGTQFDPEIAEIFIRILEREGVNILSKKYNRQALKE